MGPIFCVKESSKPILNDKFLLHIGNIILVSEFPIKECHYDLIIVSSEYCYWRGVEFELKYITNHKAIEFIKSINYIGPDFFVGDLTIQDNIEYPIIIKNKSFVLNEGACIVKILVSPNSSLPVALKAKAKVTSNLLHPALGVQERYVTIDSYQDNILNLYGILTKKSSLSSLMLEPMCYNKKKYRRIVFCKTYSVVFGISVSDVVSNNNSYINTQFEIEFWSVVTPQQISLNNVELIEIINHSFKKIKLEIEKLESFDSIEPKHTLLSRDDFLIKIINK